MSSMTMGNGLKQLGPAQTFDPDCSFNMIHQSPHPRPSSVQIRSYSHLLREPRLIVYVKCSDKLFWIMKEGNV